MKKEKTLIDMKADVVREEYIRNQVFKVMKSKKEKRNDKINKIFVIYSRLFLTFISGVTLYIVIVANSLESNIISKFLVLGNFLIFMGFSYSYFDSFKGIEE